ncbi:hypothetical protein [Neobacillus bataviensis]|uniref:hypothetical protein n=1 Tax=Neobacillus bataviensis TaxID=220685 RepID=UPI0021D9562F
MNNWIPVLLNIGTSKPFLNIFRRRRNNRGMMWGSLLGLGVSAAVFGLSRNRIINKKMMGPLQNLMNKSPIGTNQRPNFVGLTDFAKEFVPNKNPLNNK